MKENNFRKKIFKKGLVNWYEKIDPKRQLDKVPEAYFEAIGALDPEEILDYIEKIKLLSDICENPSSIMTVGVGSGIEMHALSILYPEAKICGLDVSPVAIAHAKKYLNNAGVNINKVNFFEVNASNPSDMKLKQNFDAIVMSSVLHEIFSYSKVGIEALNTSVVNVLNLLNTDGYILIRDFMPVEYGEKIILNFKNERAKRFYKYFSENYRRFKTWSLEYKKEMEDSEASRGIFPIIYEDLEVEIEPREAAEYLLHYRNYLDHINRGIISEGDLSWKELDEVYLIPVGLSTKKHKPETTINKLFQNIASIYNVNIEMSHPKIKSRPKTAKFLRMEVDIFELLTKKHITDEFLLRITSKFEIILRKKN